MSLIPKRLRTLFVIADLHDLFTLSQQDLGKFRGDFLSRIKDFHEQEEWKCRQAWQFAYAAIDKDPRLMHRLIIKNPWLVSTFSDWWFSQQIDGILFLVQEWGWREFARYYVKALGISSPELAIWIAKEWKHFQRSFTSARRS